VLPLRLSTRNILIFALLTDVLFCWSNSLKIYAKAYFAEFLIQRAWHQTLRDGKHHKPWPWADTWQVAKLRFPRLEQSYYVLSGGNGTSLAFGPGHLDGTALPNEKGTAVFGGHRDTHFRLLENIELDETFMLQSKDKRWQTYRIVDTQIADTRKGPWLIDDHRDEVHLITCYPFTTPLVGGPMRFVAIGVALSDSSLAAAPRAEPLQGLSAPQRLFVLRTNAGFSYPRAWPAGGVSANHNDP